VMFSDLIDSTMLASRLDPEEMGEVIGAYHRCVAEVVRKFDGFLAKYLGDGVLAYFGYPAAHEDDAERAVRAGLGSCPAGYYSQRHRNTAECPDRHRHRAGGR
jgi:class 3 adenylate cyclase